MATRAPAELFQYAPLPDPATHVRLLQIASGADEDDIVCSLITCKLSEAPPYVAVSYTWGEPPPTESIIINGSQLYVRWNCHYALWQTRYQKVRIHVWVDAICIAQDDLQEKNYQVQLMGEVYRRADHVLVSLGPDSADFGFLAAKLAGAPHERNGKSKRWYVSLRAECDVEQEARLFGAVVALSHNPYWSRVWIVQELVLARRIELLCGHHRLDWPKISNLTEIYPYPIVGTQEERFHCGDAFRSLMEYKRWTVNGDEVEDLEVILVKFGDNECANPLDRIYGFLHLVDWPDRNSGPLCVDYKSSPFELAVKCLDYLLPIDGVGDDHDVLSVAQRLLRALRIDSNNPDIRAAIEYRRQEFQKSGLTGAGRLEQSCNLPDSSLPGSLELRLNGSESGAPLANFITLPILAENCLRIWTSHSGSLTGELAESPDNSKFYTNPHGDRSLIRHEIRTKTLSWINQTRSDDNKVRPLMRGDVIAGFLCPRTRPVTTCSNSATLRSVS